MPPALAAALTLFGAFAFGAIQLMLGVEAPISLLILREIVLQSLLSFVLAIPVFPFVRWLLRRALIEDTPQRRPADSAASCGRRDVPARRQRPPATSQFAFRVAVLGGIALVLFSIIFLRLWYLQVLSGDKYLAEAQNNQVREIRVQAPAARSSTATARCWSTTAPRSRSRSSRGSCRAATRGAQAPDRAGRGPREDVPGRGSKEIRKQTKELPASPVTVRRDVGYPLVYFLQEHQAEFPGVTVERVFVRNYRKGHLAAHVLGHRRRGHRGAALRAALRVARAR